MYRLLFEKSAIKELKSLDGATRVRIRQKLDLLAADPSSLKSNIKKLSGKEYKGLERLRVGTYRIIFRREEDRLVVLIIRIGHRKEVY